MWADPNRSAVELRITAIGMRAHVKWIAVPSYSCCVAMGRLHLLELLTALLDQKMIIVDYKN